MKWKGTRRGLKVEKMGEFERCGGGEGFTDEVKGGCSKNNFASYAIVGNSMIYVSRQ